MTPKIVVPSNPVAPGKGWPPPDSFAVPVAYDGATWETVAARANLTPQQLIEHNFKLTPGESDFAAKINYYLKTLVGCRNTTRDGKYYIFEGANPGVVFFPIKLPSQQGTHVIVIGGVSVNEETHDKYPLNFIDPALRRGASWGKNVHYIFFAPSYEARVQKQKKEHPLVFIRRRLMQDQCASYDPRHLAHWEKDPEHFLKVVRNTASSAGHEFTAIRTTSALTATLQKIGAISTLEYYGHSDHDEMYLDYGIDGSIKSLQRWGAAQAAKIPAAKFTPGAVFASYGCKQGQAGGLAFSARNKWKIKAIGAEGKSDYVVIGDGESLFPDAPGGYYLYPAPTKSNSEPSRQRIAKSALVKP
jgi:hypothetical protein